MYTHVGTASYYILNVELAEHEIDVHGLKQYLIISNKIVKFKVQDVKKIKRIIWFMWVTIKSFVPGL